MEQYLQRSAGQTRVSGTWAKEAGRVGKFVTILEGTAPGQSAHVPSRGTTGAEVLGADVNRLMGYLVQTADQFTAAVMFLSSGPMLAMYITAKVLSPANDMRTSKEARRFEDSMAGMQIQCHWRFIYIAQGVLSAESLRFSLLLLRRPREHFGCMITPAILGRRVDCADALGGPGRYLEPWKHTTLSDRPSHSLLGQQHFFTARSPTRDRFALQTR
ncbi:hypothetical protein B0I35DRAFT_464484 [Stachybotrys elegans]|uniref:Uncharacterized protein n=1 Tax=Stachybotrys elegans TaxID=80388 RepID=A0A8K0SKG9_9HYPO|nr:hypothetical protein B0I35DRAFT_464484 [Stachybotrys elegans]